MTEPDPPPVLAIDAVVDTWTRQALCHRPRRKLPRDDALPVYSLADRPT